MMDLYDLTLKVVEIRTALLEGNKKKAAFKIAKLQADLETLDDEGYILINKENLFTLVKSEYSDLSNEILK